MQPIEISLSLNKNTINIAQMPATKNIRISLKTFLPLLFIIGMSGEFMGQTLTQTVTGMVLDADSGEPLIGAYASVVGSETTLSAVTDVNGKFFIENVSVGRVSIKFGYLGYEDYILSEALVTSAKQLNLTVRLRESIQKLDEVVIKAKKDNIKPNNNVALISARSFSVEETKRFPASISDPGRMALSYAGVSSADDGTNEIIIRGNAPDQLLWRIEGVEVPNPNHFAEQGYSTGAISILNTNMLERSDFFTGAFPAEYGNALSGVFDINLRSGNSNKREHAFQFGVLGTDLTMEGPFKEGYGGSYLVNYRYSTLGLLNEVIEISDGSVPTFQDMSFKVSLPLGTKTLFSLWGIGGYSEDNADDSEFEEMVFDEIFESKTYMGGATLKHFFKNKSRLEIKLSTSGASSDYLSTSRDTLTNEMESDSDLLSSSANRLTLNYFKKLNSRSSFKLGVIGSALRYDVETKYTEDNIEVVEVDKDGTADMIQAFVQGKHRLNEVLSIVAGVHTTHFSLNDQTTIEPRMGLEWVVHPKHSISAGFGIHSRIYSLNQYFVNAENTDGIIETPNMNLDFMTSNHYILGYDWRLIKNGHLKVEGYLQQLNNVGVAKDPEKTGAVVNGGFLDIELSDEGKGENIGLDITFEKFFSDQYYFLITSSFFNSKYQALNGQWYNSDYNSRNTFSFVGGKEFTVGKEDNNIVGVNLKVLTNGGRRASPIDIEYLNDTGNYRFDQLQRNSLKLSSYFRTDISVYYQINRPKVAHSLSLDIQNTTDNQNVGGQFIDQDSGEITTFTQLGLLPILNYKIEF